MKDKIIVTLVIMIVVGSIGFLIYDKIKLYKNPGEYLICSEDIISCEDKECLVANRCYEGEDSWVEEFVRPIRVKPFK